MEMGICRNIFDNSSDCQVFRESLSYQCFTDWIRVTKIFSCNVFSYNNAIRVFKNIVRIAHYKWKGEDIKEIAVNKKYFLFIKFFILIFKQKILSPIRICK